MAGSDVRAIDPTQLSKHFEAASAEERWDREWERSGIYRYDPRRQNRANAPARGAVSNEQIRLFLIDNILEDEVR